MRQGRVKVLKAGAIGLLLLLGGCSFEEPFTNVEPFFSIRVDGRWGFVDRSGIIVVPPVYDAAQDFSEGFAAVLLGGKWGYINLRGEVVIPLQYRQAFSFSEGLSVVDISLGRDSVAQFGYIDYLGEIVIDAHFDSAESFSEGLAVVARDGSSFFVDKDGRVPFGFGYTLVNNFSESLALVLFEGRWRYVNDDGRIVITLDTLAPAADDDDFPGFSIDEFMALPSRFSKGLALVKVLGRECRYFDRFGVTQIAVDYTTCGTFSEGLALVGNVDPSDPTEASFARGGNLYSGGFINSSGQLVISLKFTEAKPFSEGLAAIFTDTDSYYIDRKGEVVLNPEHRKISSFRDGLAKIYVTPEEQSPTPSPLQDSDVPGVDSNSDSRRGRSSVRRRWSPFGYIDKTGRWVWSPTM
jgi:hypothetical protein